MVVYIVYHDDPLPVPEVSSVLARGAARVRWCTVHGRGRGRGGGGGGRLGRGRGRGPGRRSRRGGADRGFERRQFRQRVVRRAFRGIFWRGIIVLVVWRRWIHEQFVVFIVRERVVVQFVVERRLNQFVVERGRSVQLVVWIEFVVERRLVVWIEFIVERRVGGRERRALLRRDQLPQRPLSYDTVHLYNYQWGRRVVDLHGVRHDRWRGGPSRLRRVRVRSSRRGLLDRRERERHHRSVSVTAC